MNIQKIQKSTWAIVVLFVVLAATNFNIYQMVKTHEIEIQTQNSSWLEQQNQINRLQHCIDEGIKPCDFIPPKQ